MPETTRSQMEESDQQTSYDLNSALSEAKRLSAYWSSRPVIASQRESIRIDEITNSINARLMKTCFCCKYMVFCSGPNCTRFSRFPGLLKICSGCELYHYCSKQCQKKAWKTGHKSDCLSIRAERSTYMPGSSSSSCVHCTVVNSNI